MICHVVTYKLKKSKTVRTGDGDVYEVMIDYMAADVIELTEYNMMKMMEYN